VQLEVHFECPYQDQYQEMKGKETDFKHNFAKKEGKFQKAKMPMLRRREVKEYNMYINDSNY
jgi:hypothetical protein